MAELIIVGSGAAATAAALALVQAGHRPVMLDVGHVDESAAPRVEGNLYSYRAQHDSFDLHIGADYRGLAGVLSDEPTVAKLKELGMDLPEVVEVVRAHGA